MAVPGHPARKGSGQPLDVQDEAGTFELSFCSTNLVGRNEACIFFKLLVFNFLNMVTASSSLLSSGI